MKQPFLDLKRLNEPYFADFEELSKQFFNSGWFIMGQKLLEFERNFAQFCQTKHCLGVANGLDALEIIWQAFDFPKESEIIVPANTYIASILSVSNVGMKPVFVEPNIETYNLDYQKIESKITSKTKAILIVHLYGKCLEMKPIIDLAKKYNLKIVEDAAQAHGAIDLTGKSAGNLSDAAAFSFYPTKNLGALGDGGAITTNDDWLANRIKKIRNYGSEIKYENEIIGRNSRLDELQAAFLNHKLQFLKSDNLRRKQIAKRYFLEITNKKLTLPSSQTLNQDAWHLFVVRHPERTLFMQNMAKNGIETMIQYPIPPHKQPAYSQFADLDLPITEKIHQEVVSLPINPYLTEAEVSAIIKAVNKS